MPAKIRCGVDEAGKGPVIGPMVAACVRADETALPSGINDSKQVTPTKRESIAQTLVTDPSIEIGLGIITVEEIDDPQTDMNSLTVRGQVRAINAVVNETDEVVVDAGDVSAERFGNRIVDGVSTPVTVVSEHRADEMYPLVAAASIVAKVERDRRIEALKAEYADFGDLGSGYPSDPNTRSFLETYIAAHGDVPACARRSWATCDDLLAAASQSGLSDFD